MKKKTMALIKCTECGHEVSDKAFSCPNCGSPIEKEIVCSECGEKLGPNDKVCPQCGCPIKADDTTKSSECNFDMYPTTDTGTSNEETLKSLVNFIWAFTKILFIIECFVPIIGAIVTRDALLLAALLPLILFVIIPQYFLMKITCAFIMVLHNISINIREINMKLK